MSASGPIGTFFDRKRQREILDAAKAGKPLPPRGVAKPLAEKPARNPIAPERQAKLDGNLWAAVDCGYFRGIEEAIEGGADVNARRAWGVTPLMWACRHGLEGLMKLLVSKGADMNAKDEFGHTALKHLDLKRSEVRKWTVVYDLQGNVSLDLDGQGGALDGIKRMENLLKRFGAKGDFG